jgi:hypothetical protein
MRFTPSFVAITAAIALAIAPACGGGGADDDDTGADAMLPPQPDEDGDGISDTDEGRAAGTDTDGDGTPDYQDDDSDGDGVPDFREAGDADTNTQPWDSDGDGAPDFRDTDADGNGIPDATDGTGDLDSDNVADFQDRDDDGDNMFDVNEIGPEASMPIDSDGDMAPDYRDTDSDNDTILDRHELTSDPDMDMIPAFRDTDADGDCRGDALEAGDADLQTPPIDSDGDGGGDFIDLDSDGDGLKDQLEDVNCNGMLDMGESSTLSADTDMDGVTDLVEVAAGTDPQNAGDNPQANGDFVFLEPYMAPPTPTEDQLEFATAFRKVDVMFTIDISGSMQGEITSVKNSITTVIDTLTCNAGEDPVTTGCIPDLQTGVASYGHLANPPIHEAAGFPFKPINSINLTSDGANSTQASLPSTAPGNGAEQHLRAIAADESGTANDGYLRNTCASDATRFSRACYRPDSLRLVVEITDEPLTQDTAFAASPGNCGSAACQAMLAFMVQNNIQLVGAWSGDGGTQGNLVTQWAGLISGGVRLVPVVTTTMIGTPACNALGAGAFHTDAAGIRAIVRGDGASAANAVTCAVQAVVRFVAQDVRTLAKNDPANVDAAGQPVDAPVAFIDHIEVFMNNSMQCPDYPTTQDSNGDGFPDVFIDLLPGKNVCWKIFVKMNQTVMPSDEPQMFRATIDVTNENGALLDTRDVFFLVPPEIISPPVD